MVVGEGKRGAEAGWRGGRGKGGTVVGGGKGKGGRGRGDGGMWWVEGRGRQEGLEGRGSFFVFEWTDEIAWDLKTFFIKNFTQSDVTASLFAYLLYTEMSDGVFAGLISPPFLRNASRTSSTTWPTRCSNTLWGVCMRPTNWPSPCCWHWRLIFMEERLSRKSLILSSKVRLTKLYRIFDVVFVVWFCQAHQCGAFVWMNMHPSSTICSLLHSLTSLLTELHNNKQRILGASINCTGPL